jgi:hypothetical protein
VFVNFAVDYLKARGDNSVRTLASADTTTRVSLSKVRLPILMEARSSVKNNHVPLPNRDHLQGLLNKQETEYEVRPVSCCNGINPRHRAKAENLFGFI